MVYYIYHIPGKKIGVTVDPTKRVQLQQGYQRHEYEILEVSGDIDYISNREIELQKQYGYPIDSVKYNEIGKFNNQNSMNINVTDQTTTFPWPLSKLKGNLMDNLGFAWVTLDGKFVLTTDTVHWIEHNSFTSQYNSDRCFIYNKALSEYTLNIDKETSQQTTYDLIRQWAKDRGIYDKGDIKTQYIKLLEEAGELAQAILKNDRTEITDAIGDMVVVLTNLAHFKDLTIEECIDSAYDVISKRTGKMVGGTFVKDRL